MALLQMALLPLLGWRCLPFGAARIRTLLGFSALCLFPIQWGQEKTQGRREPDCKKLPRKSIQYYLAMYPRINGQVSSITWRSKLAAFSCPVCSGGQDGCLDWQEKGDVMRPAGVSGARSCRCSCPSVCGGEVPGIQWTETSRAVLSVGDCP